jgi:hypothetical protein
MNKLFFLLLSLNSLSVLALTPIEDDSLALVSGQSGISVDMEVDSARIGEVRYEDSDGSTSLSANGNTGSLSLSDVEITNMSFTFDIDVTDSALVFQLTRFAPTDFLIGDIIFNNDTSLDSIDFAVQSTSDQLQQQYSSLGSLSINDFTIADTDNVTFKFGNDAEGNASFQYTTSLSTGSYFYLTYMDDGEFIYDPDGDGDLTDNEGHNYISTKVTFDEFEVEDISFHGKEIDDQSYLEMTLAGISGGIAFEDITINDAVLGTVGMENFVADPVSYFRIQGK